MTKPLLDHAEHTQSSLNYAVSLQKTAASVGFDWTDIRGVIAKIHEELEEVSDEIGIDNNQARLLEEFGDLLFACTNLARHLDIDPEQALQLGNQKFYRRFCHVELLAEKAGKPMQQHSLEQLDNYWEQVKKAEKNTLT
jgi:ATP diphosphatase